jgi:hypothetical protein
VKLKVRPQIRGDWPQCDESDAPCRRGPDEQCPALGREYFPSLLKGRSGIARIHQYVEISPELRRIVLEPVSDQPVVPLGDPTFRHGFGSAHKAFGTDVSHPFGFSRVLAALLCSRLAEGRAAATLDTKEETPYEESRLGYERNGLAGFS